MNAPITVVRMVIVLMELVCVHKDGWVWIVVKPIWLMNPFGGIMEPKS